MGGRLGGTMGGLGGLGGGYITPDDVQVRVRSIYGDKSLTMVEKSARVYALLNPSTPSTPSIGEIEDLHSLLDTNTLVPSCLGVHSCRPMT